jgi:hypothetical protein
MAAIASLCYRLSLSQNNEKPNNKTKKVQLSVHISMAEEYLA